MKFKDLPLSLAEAFVSKYERTPNRPVEPDYDSLGKSRHEGEYTILPGGYKIEHCPNFPTNELTEETVQKMILAYDIIIEEDI